MTLAPSPLDSGHRAGLVVELAVGELGLGTAWFDPQRKFRYRLSRTWDPLRQSLLWVLLNPSGADGTHVDPTLRRVLGFSRRCGFGGVDVINLFARRASKPIELLKADDPIGPGNDEVITEAIASADCVVLGWGNGGTIGNRAASILGLIEADTKAVLSLGVTAQGQPRHPLYVPDTQKLIPWRDISKPGDRPCQSSSRRTRRNSSESSRRSSSARP